MRIYTFIIVVTMLSTVARAQETSMFRPFDAGWKFKVDSTIAAESPGFDDSSWRILDLPHDWSIEDLPGQKPDAVSGPFSRNSVGKSSTGFTVGGVGWYRKRFSTNAQMVSGKTLVRFDGVYMNADVWLNGHHLADHIYGYTPFVCDLSPYLSPKGQENVLVVRVRNNGKNSRWYAGSGIYRHVWMAVKSTVRFEPWGVQVVTPDVDTKQAKVRVNVNMLNGSGKAVDAELRTSLLAKGGVQVAVARTSIKLAADAAGTATTELTVSNPLLWSPDKPSLYEVRSELWSGGKMLDVERIKVGIRKLEVDGVLGLRINGKPFKLKGGCVHHDLGPLGTACIDRAEERKVELLKAEGYNAIRSSHNPISEAFLEACDRLGMVVVDEAFDMWVMAKNSDDYHLYFKEHWRDDLRAMILQARNHPSVIMWSIGNEIYEASDPTGHELAGQLASEARSLDPTRPVTSGIVFLPPYTRKPWSDYQPFLAKLDVDGYNYFLEKASPYFVRDSATASRFDNEHALHPNKAYMATEYAPTEALQYWEKTLKDPYFLGGFKWTAMDYIGEAGVGRPLVLPETRNVPKGIMGMSLFFADAWPVFQSYSGDIDLIGDRKAAAYYQGVVWGNSPVELLVHSPVPAGQKEVVAPFGFADEQPSWSWPGQEGKYMDVMVYTSAKRVVLELNGAKVEQKDVPEGTVTSRFRLPYQPGELVAKCYDGGKLIGTKVLVTTGQPRAIRLKADRQRIRADRNDLSFISVEILDDKGRLVPFASGQEVSFSLEGAAEIAAVGNGNYADASSFQQPRKKTFHGKALVILRPKGAKGAAKLTATCPGLTSGNISITIE